MQILGQYRTPHDHPQGEIILVDKKGGYHPFVTWWRKVGTDERYFGHYFGTREEAKEDFADRVLRGY